jgi:hypothetical protein
MSDTLYLSLWYPNLRLAAMAEKLTAVLSAFAAHGGEARVYSSTVWPVSWSESPVLQNVYGRRTDPAGQRGAEPAAAVAETLELLHDDYAYEFQIGWSLWELERAKETADPSTPLRSAQDGLEGLGSEVSHPSRKERVMDGAPGVSSAPSLVPYEARWVREPRLVRVTGYGPLFDDGAYESDGHIRIDFGPDGPFLEEGVELDSVAARHVEENVRQLIELTVAVEKASGATARLLWSELGESLAQRLAARLGVAN